MNKKLVVSCSLIIVVAIAFLKRPSTRELELTDCRFDRIAETKINFFVDQGLLESMSIQDVKKSLSSSIKYANQVLKNSCIPLTRVLGHIELLHIDKSKVQNLDSASRLIRNTLSEQGVIVSELAPSEKYGLLFHGKHENQLKLSGQASPYFGSWLFALSSTAPIHAMEHELGHLSWTQHEESIPVPNLTMRLKSAVPEDFHDKLVPYARAIKCGNSGTIMSYERNILPIYSNPKIKYQGKYCGDAESADNSRVMRQYALKLLSSN
ncbi:hypothetical protein TW78_00770 [Vibrio coralliilyticus]|uniref:Uncharacterized protein n=1 Tax=Vibrio coralliilyticus TaxID=190893 RepID=A0A837G2Y9_9VIBR|nr:hypothetical protein [Vibrio coralliilyticus]KJY79269.1 hypothetical protein TW78_00770 [Vibrio coralliilyticus]QOU30815.1 hypothetical protein TW71_004715 [Vibrio coralliilyticus]